MENEMTHQPPEPDQVLFTIGPYQCVKLIGEGGMGQVYLAYDTVAKKHVALKRLQAEDQAKERARLQFLKEAEYTSKLCHPAIIPIYSIVQEGDVTYYTMPFIEGRTLKELLKTTHEQGDPQGSVPSLCHIFLHICQAVAYAHSKGFMHRDLKPSNIMIGSYGQLVILDWGLVMLAPKEDEKKKQDRVVGTMPYMAPELICGESPSYQAEVYSLGITFYKMLTLRHPFHRSNAEQYAKNFEKEVLVDPAVVAPFRNIPPILSHIVSRCLAVMPENRYQTVEELIGDLETYLEGRDSWIKIASLDVKSIPHWEVIKKNRRLSHGSFAGDIKIEAKICLNKGRVGIFPHATDTSAGGAVWLSTKHIEKGVVHNIRIESRDNSLLVYANDRLLDVMCNYLPHVGSRIGLVVDDNDAVIDEFSISVRGTSFRANPLVVADTLLAEKKYAKALSEYRQLAFSNANREEGERRSSLPG